jgi:benzoate/toluate 1,2-dioxygenase beta subunit
MTHDPVLLAEVSALIQGEARLLDKQSWDEWLALYCEDAVFWVPAFRMDGSLTENPATELSMIHIVGRANLGDRIFRVRTEIALSATPVPRTSHLVGQPLIERDDAGEVEASVAWQVVWSNDVRGQRLRAGTYHYTLRRDSGGQNLRIARKKVLLLDPVIDGYFDVYSV